MGDGVKMDACIKVCLIAVMAVLLLSPLKQEKAVFGLLASFALGLGILFLSLGRLQRIMEALRQLIGYMGAAGGYLGILLKVLGITYVCEFAAEILIYVINSQNFLWNIHSFFLGGADSKIGLTVAWKGGEGDGALAGDACGRACRRNQ